MVNPMRRMQPTRMMGLASGMDTDFIIQQTLRMHQFKIDNQLRNRRLIEWRQQTHNTIKDEITNIRQTFLSNLGSKSMMNRNAFNATTATVSGNTNNAVSIRTTAGSPLGNFQINSVKQVAQGAHLSTTGGVTGSNGNGFASGIRLGDMTFAGGGKIEWDNLGGTVRVGNENVKIERDVDEFGNGTGSLRFIGADGEALTVENGGISWNGNAVTITAGGSTRTLNWNEAGNSFTEDRVGMFNHVFTIPDGDSTRNITITATQNQSNGNWSFTSNIGNASLNAEGILTVRIGSGDSAVTHELGEWDPLTRTVEKDGTTTTLNQMTQPALQLAGEAVLTFTTGTKGTEIQEIGGVEQEVDVLLNERITRVTIRATDTMSEMITRINGSGAGVNMSYDRLSDKFTLETSLNGSDPSKMHLSASGNNFFDLISGPGGTATFNDGQEAIAWINGTEVVRNTNTFDFRGVTVTLNERFNVGFDPDDDKTFGDPIQITLSRDTNMAFDRIKEFIDSYNAIIRRLEGLLNERKTGNEASYRPLTDEEKQGMSDRQIEEWEAIARKGILRNDNGIQNLVSSLRRSFFEEIEGLGVSPASIGLTTGSYFDGTGGQIMIDEERLRAAIERDPDMIADIFISIDTSGPSPRGVGLLHKIDGLMRDFVNTTQTTSIKNLEDSMKRANEQIQRMQERMWAEEDRLYRQFAAMESAMSKLNQQGDWFASMLGG